MSKSIIFTYPGGKGKLANWVTSVFPDSGNHYLEPFAGRANIFWKVIEQGRSFKTWQLNDTKTYKFLHEVKQNGNIDPPIASKTEYEKYRDLFKLGDRDAILLEPFLTFSGGGYGSGARSGRFCSQKTYKKRIIDAHTILNKYNVRLTCVDWEQTIQGLTQDDFVYLDPPYIGAAVKAYKNNTLDHERMAQILSDAKFKWVLSEYKHPIYLKYLGTPKVEQAIRLLVHNFKHQKEDNRVECLWHNV